VLRGENQPKNAAERFEFGSLCYNLKRYSASARLIAEAFQADPKLAEDMKVQNRYNAACAAALAGCGQGRDEPPMDEAAKSRWRKQAIEWLKADLAFWNRQVETGPQQAKAFVVQTLQHWKVDTDLAGIRDEAALAKLPEDERKACRSLWTEVDALIKKAQSARP
jgi:serine/threonine-protein kinase